MIDWILDHPRLVAFVVGAIAFTLLSMVIPDWRFTAGMILLLLAERIYDDWRF